MSTFYLLGPDPKDVVKTEGLIDAGPLCVAPVWDWKKREPVRGLYFIYLKRLGLHIGPFYAELILAEKDMRKVLKQYPQSFFWEQSLEWYQRQGSFMTWIEKNMGKPQDLVGAQWA